MPTWGEVLKELQGIASEQAAKGPPIPGAPSPFDVLRRRYLRRLNELTGRAVIVYQTAWLESRQMDEVSATVHLGDLQGFMEAVSNVSERELDLILHSPGGSAEAAEAIMDYLRTRFDHIRVIVPVAAMSAATMMALGADEIVMGAHSQLGPIDPQFTVNTPEGPRSSPGQAILDQFEIAKTQCQDPKNLAAWLPILRYYGPGLIAMCDHQRVLAEQVVKTWLERYMFAGDSDADTKAQQAAEWFADFKRFLSHGRRVPRDLARQHGIKVKDLEQNDEEQDAILSVHHAVQHTLSATATVKLVENHHGRAWIKISQPFNIPMTLPPLMPMPVPAAPPTP